MPLPTPPASTPRSRAPGADPERQPVTPLEVSPDQVHQWLQAGEAVLVDVREPDEYARERIPGSHHVPLSRFDPAPALGFAKAGQRVVLHCRGGRRSTDACRLAGAGGAIGFYTMTGGIEAWKAAGLAVITDRTKLRLSTMRQVQLVIGIGVLIGSALTWFVDPGFVVVPAFFGAGLTFAGASGTCALATLIGMLPWNASASGSSTCSVEDRP